MASCCLYRVELKEFGRQQSRVRICIAPLIAVQPKFHTAPQFPTKRGKPARPGFPPGVIKCNHSFEG